jgi:hypothetical protein
MSELLKPEQVHDHGNSCSFHHGVGVFQLLAVAHHVGGQFAGRITWYIRRLNGGWGGARAGLFHFVVPFVLLFSPVKRDITRLVWLAVWMLLMRWVDLFWVIEPNFSVNFRVTPAELLCRLPWADSGCGRSATT